MIKAVIFDFDGVIIDSEAVRYRTIEKLFLDNFNMKTPSFEDTVKSNKQITVKSLKETYSINEDLQSLYAKRNKLLSETFSDSSDILPVKGLFEFLISLKKEGYKIAIGTSGFRNYVESILDTLNIRKFFEVLVTREDVQHKKPAPDTFLLAAKKLGVEAGDCLVLEDAQHGLEAANAAGMKCIGITTTRSKDALKEAGADVVVNDFTEINLDGIKNF